MPHEDLAAAAEPQSPSHVRSNIREYVKRDGVDRGLICILALWAFACVVLLVLHKMQTGFGFQVWPIGEDRNWLYFLQHHESRPAQKAFWEVDGRNPLAPWWYLAARPLIEGATNGIYLVRKLTDLMAGISVYLAVRTATGRQYSWPATVAGALAVLWSFSETPSQIVWSMTVAMCLSLLSIAAYCTFLNSERTKAFLFGISLLLYLCALATYTLQAGAVIAVFAFGFWSGAPHGISPPNYAKRLKVALADSIPFVITFSVYLMIWNTTTTFAVDVSADRISRAQQLSRVLTSATFLFWHPIYSQLLKGVSALPTSAMYASIISAVLVGISLAVACGRAGRALPPATASAFLHFATKVAVITAAVTLPTIALESSSGTWVPGTRTFMIQQGVQPLLLCCALYGVALICSKLPVGGKVVTLTVCAAIASTAFLMLLRYNYQQVQMTAAGQSIVAGLKRILPVVDKPTLFILRGAHGTISPYNSDIFVKTAYKTDNVNLRILVPGYIQGWEGYADVVAGSAEEGVYAETTLGVPKFILRNAPAWIPYSDVIFAAFDGEQVHALPLTAANVAGYRVYITPTAPQVMTTRGLPLISGSLRDWQMVGPELTREGAVVLSNDKGAGAYDLMQRRIAAKANRSYEFVVEAKSAESGAVLNADLYGGPAYDSGQQDYRLSGFSPEYKRMSFIIPAGANPTPVVFVRLTAVAQTPIYIRSVDIYEK